MIVIVMMSRMTVMGSNMTATDPCFPAPCTLIPHPRARAPTHQALTAHTPTHTYTHELMQGLKRQRLEGRGPYSDAKRGWQQAGGSEGGANHRGHQQPTAGPSQEWRGAAPTGTSARNGEAKAKTQTQTHTPQAPAKIGGVQATVLPLRTAPCCAVPDCMPDSCCCREVVCVVPCW